MFFARRLRFSDRSIENRKRIVHVRLVGFDWKYNLVAFRGDGNTHESEMQTCARARFFGFPACVAGGGGENKKSRINKKKSSRKELKKNGRVRGGALTFFPRVFGPRPTTVRVGKTAAEKILYLFPVCVRVMYFFPEYFFSPLVFRHNNVIFYDRRE